MKKLVKQLLIFSLVFALYLIVFLVFILGPETDVLYSFVRILGLFGLLNLFISSIMAAFTKEIYQLFGKPFKKVHHIVAYTGLAMIILHPVFYSIVVKSANVFVPDFSNWKAFLSLAGRPALYLIILAVIAGLLQPRIKKWWRYIHGLNYLALLLGVIHGMWAGTSDLSTSVILQIIYITLIILATAAFAFKRYKSIKRKKLRKTKKEEKVSQ